VTRDETIAFLQRYLDAVSRCAVGDELAQFYTPDVRFTEHPNKLVPNGVTRDLAAILKAAESGRAILASQSYEIHDTIVEGDRAVLLMLWEGAFKIDVPALNLKAGGEMRARFCQVYRLRDGRIAEQQTFDCIEPW